jgi:hypothetical protein
VPLFESFGTGYNFKTRTDAIRRQFAPDEKKLAKLWKRADAQVEETELRRNTLTDTDWKKEMLEIREMCQALEDALMDDGWDEISIRTKHGKVTWRTDDRAAQIEENQDSDLAEVEEEEDDP